VGIVCEAGVIKFNPFVGRSSTPPDAKFSAIPPVVSGALEQRDVSREAIAIERQSAAARRGQDNPTYDRAEAEERDAEPSDKHFFQCDAERNDAHFVLLPCEDRSGSEDWLPHQPTRQ
jgi:hypothetical protein